MSVVKDLIVAGNDGSLSFGNYELPEKAKKSGFEVKGDSYKVKTYSASTRLEKNDSLVYESEPGTAVQDFIWNENGLSFTVECPGDCQIVLGLADDATYRIIIDGKDTGMMETGMAASLSCLSRCPRAALRRSRFREPDQKIHVKHV